MELEEAMKTLLDFIRCAEEEFGKVKYTSTSMNVDDGDIEAISTVLQELDRLQKENEKLKAKQVMQEFKIDWCEKNTIKKCNIKAIFSTYEARREQGELVIGYHTLKEFVKKILGEK